MFSIYDEAAIRRVNIDNKNYDEEYIALKCTDGSVLLMHEVLSASDSYNFKLLTDDFNTLVDTFRVSN